MKNIKLTIQYDGTNYSGWQRQKNAVAVQEKLENAIKKVTGKFSGVIGSGRTDAGVHAREFVCNFFTDSKIPAPNFEMVLNGVLPDDIVVLKSEHVDDNFHARFCSKGKRYVYTVITGDNRPAIGRQYVYYFRRKLNLEKIQMACGYFLGTHDFSAFKKKGGTVRSPIRTISEMTAVQKGKFIKFSVTGNGFLYNMVRIMVGTLLEVGVGRFKPEDVKYILESGDRAKAGEPAPAKGLCLEKVFY